MLLSFRVLWALRSHLTSTIPLMLGPCVPIHHAVARGVSLFGSDQIMLGSKYLDLYSEGLMGPPSFMIPVVNVTSQKTYFKLGTLYSLNSHHDYMVCDVMLL